MLELKNRARDLDHKKRTAQCFGLEEQLKLETSRKGVRRKLTASLFAVFVDGEIELKRWITGWLVKLWE